MTTEVERRVITDEVRCPWCGAEPGQSCTEGISSPPYVRNLPYGRGHLARTKPVPCQHCGGPLRWNGEWNVWRCSAGCSDGDPLDYGESEDT